MVLIAVLAFLTWWYWPILRPWGRWLLSGAPLRTRATSTATNSLVIVVVATSSPTPSEQALASEPTALLAVTPSEPTPTSAALPLPTPGPTETPTPGAATATATPTRPSGMAVRVETSADAWLRAVADGTPVFEGTLSGGEALDWQARQSFQMLTGNAGGTRLLINGQDVGTLGDSGDVVEGTWLWQGGQVVTPTPEG
jgi:hypothetical protein